MPGLPSIKARVAVIAAALLAILSSLLLLLAWRGADHAAEEAFDRIIGASALTIADSMRLDDDRIKVELPPTALAFIGLQGSSRIFFKVADPKGGLVTGQMTLGLALPAATLPGPVFSSGEHRGEAVRFAVVGRYFDGGWASVIVAETMEARRALAWKLFVPALTVVACIAVIALGFIVFGLERAFKPFAFIEAELRTRPSTDLSPLTAPAPEEAQVLVTAVNGLMQRLQGVLDRVNNYANYAAHELRTPIVLMRAQVAAALAEPKIAGARARLIQIQANAEAASQVVDQILSDAAVLYRLGLAGSGHANLALLCDEVLERFDPPTQAAIQLRVSCEDRKVCEISGDPIALREAIRNLVDNARRYSVTGAIAISIRREDKDWVVEVSELDTEADKGAAEPLSKRFPVMDAEGNLGGGLGLHMVRRVAEASGGVLELAKRPQGGLSARLRLAATFKAPREPVNS